MIGHRTKLPRSGQKPNVAKTKNVAPHWRTLSHSGLQPNVAQIVPLIGGLCHAVDFNQMWPKLCPSLEDFVTQRTKAKCGPKCALVGGLCHAADFDQMWPKLCSSSEDFVTQRTSTKCGSNCAPHWRTLSCSGLQPNVAQIVPLTRGLCHAADFDQMLSKMCPSLEGFVT